MHVRAVGVVVKKMAGSAWHSATGQHGLIRFFDAHEGAFDEGTGGRWFNGE